VTEPRPDDAAVADPGKEVPAGRRSFVPILALSAVVAFVLAVGAMAFLPGVACACTPTIPTIPASPVDGVVVEIDSAGLDQVKGFTLRTPDGGRVTFTLGSLENATEFPPGHLAEHRATSSPVRVFYRLEAGVPTVYRLEDAP
jgi:hypothetical protein